MDGHQPDTARLLRDLKEKKPIDIHWLLASEADLFAPDEKGFNAFDYALLN